MTRNNCNANYEFRNKKYVMVYLRLKLGFFWSYLDYLSFKDKLTCREFLDEDSSHE